MKKIPVCKSCGETGHYAISCRQTPRKPIKTSPKPLSSKSKVTKPKKKETRAQLKKKAWDAFSSYIRARDCLATTGTREWGICITCNERGDASWKEYRHIQAGHAVGGRSNAVLFNEEIVNGQCDYCNTKAPYGLGGDYGNYAIALIKRYGLEHVQELQRLKGSEMKYTIQDFREIIEVYKKKLYDLA